MKSEEMKARLLIEDAVVDGEKTFKIQFDGTLEKYSAFIAAAIVGYRDAIAENFGSASKKEVNEALKEFIELEETKEEVLRFPAKVYDRLKNVDIDRDEMLARLLANLLDNIKRDIEDDIKAEFEND